MMCDISKKKERERDRNEVKFIKHILRNVMHKPFGE